MIKIYAIAAIALALAGLIGYGIHIKNKADRVDVAEARAATAEKYAADTAERFLKAAESDRSTQAELADIRAATAAQALSFAQALKAKPLTHEVSHVDPATGVTSTCHERDYERYRELFNSAAEGLAVTNP